jgi:hypothetical protein
MTTLYLIRKHMSNERVVITLKCARRFPEITFISHAQSRKIAKPNNLTFYEQYNQRT